MPTNMFINLPVKDMARTTEFFTGLGFTFNEQFSSDSTACMVVNDGAFAMLHVEPVFAGFVGGAVADTSTGREVIVGLSADSREQVDDLVARAVAGGAQPLGDAQDDGFMYMRAFRDLDGHQWSFLAMG